MGAENGNGGVKRPRRRSTGQRPGRPELAPAERRSDRLPAPRVTAAERAIAEAKAARAGLHLTDYMRDAALGARIVERGASARSSIPPGLLSDLNRIGNNLNQVAHAAHLGRSLPAMAAQTLAELRGLVALIVARLDRDDA